MARGELSPSDAQAIIASLEALSRSLIYDGHEQRLAALEALLAGERDGLNGHEQAIALPPSSV